MSLGARSADVAVIGAGPAGAAAARTLAEAGWGTLLLSGRGEAQQFGETLPPPATPLLERLGLGPAFRATRPLPCYANRSSWGSGGRLIDHDFIREPYGSGWHIDRGRFDAMLHSWAEQAGARRLDGRVLCAVERRGGAWQLRLDDASVVVAPSVVDASGRRAAFARRIGVRRIRTDALVAAVTTLRSRDRPPDDSTTLVEATAEGWWYSAVVPSGSMVAAFVTAPRQLAAAKAWTADGWQGALARTVYTRDRIERSSYERTGRPRLAAASSARLEVAAGDGWVAAGDAAAAHDPLASDGIGCAVADGAAAARALRAHAGGDCSALVEFSERVKRSFSHYESLRTAYYADEDRWPDAPFWRSRRGALTPAAMHG